MCGVRLRFDELSSFDLDAHTEGRIEVVGDWIEKKLKAWDDS